MSSGTARNGAKGAFTFDSATGVAEGWVSVRKSTPTCGFRSWKRRYVVVHPGEAVQLLLRPCECPFALSSSFAWRCV